MAIEKTPERRRRDRKRQKKARNEHTWGGRVTTRKASPEEIRALLDRPMEGSR